MQNQKPIEAQRSDAAHLLLRTCVKCDTFDHEAEVCKRFNARPPAKVIAYGCDEFIEEIPF